mgnify:CR=1 FL=1
MLSTIIFTTLKGETLVGVVLRSRQKQLLVQVLVSCGNKPDEGDTRLLGIPTLLLHVWDERWISIDDVQRPVCVFNRTTWARLRAFYRPGMRDVFLVSAKVLVRLAAPVPVSDTEFTYGKDLLLILMCIYINN